MPHKTQKPTIIFVHGFRGTHYGLLDVASRLEDDFTILAPDIPGSGTEPELDHKTLDGYAEWLHQYIKNRRLKQPYIVGHSMGSIIVSHFIERYPDDVAHKVVLMSPIFRSRIRQRRSNALYKAARGGLFDFKQRAAMPFACQPSTFLHYFAYFNLRQNSAKTH